MNKPEKPKNTSGQILQISIPLLVIVVGLEIGGLVFGRKSTQLESSGVVTTAEVYDVTQDLLGDSLELLFHEASNRSSSSRSKISHWTIYYRYVTAEGVEVKSSRSGKAYEAPSIGREFEIRYSELDPTIHETAVGHTTSQIAALHWIAAFFAAIGIITVACILGSAWMSPKTTREKRLKRMEELASKKD